MIDLLKAAKIEMVLGPLVTHKDSTGLIQETISHEETEFYCRPGNPLAKRQILARRTLAPPPGSSEGAIPRSAYESTNILRDLT